MYDARELTVSELIALLQQCPQNAKVKFEFEDEWDVFQCETRTRNGNSTVYLGTSLWARQL